MASIEKRRIQGDKTKKRPQYAYDVRYRDASRRARKQTFRRKADADRFARNVETDKDRGQYIDPVAGRIAFEDCAKRYLATVVHLKPKTLQDYESLLRSRVLPELGKRQVGSIRPADLRRWVAGMAADGLSPARIRHAYRLAAAILRAAVDDGYIAASPARGVKLPRLTLPEITALTAEEIELIADAIEEPYGIWVLVTAYTGLRYGEAAALRRKDCDLLRSRLHISESLSEAGGAHFGDTKTHQARTVPIPESVKDALAAHLAANVESDPNGLVFTAEKGGPLLYSNFYRKVWKPALARVGIELPPGKAMHVLRASFASILGTRGRPLREAQAFLGHKSISTTDRYSHFFVDEMDRGAEALDAARSEAIREGARHIRAIESVTPIRERRAKHK